MAKFSLKKPLKLIIRSASTSVVQNTQGAAVAVQHPSKVLELKSGIFTSNDPEVIERIRGDIYFGTSEGIIEITEEEQEAIDIRDKKFKEAEIEIKEAKKKRQTK